MLQLIELLIHKRQALLVRFFHARLGKRWKQHLARLATARNLPHSFSWLKPFNLSRRFLPRRLRDLDKIHQIAVELGFNPVIFDEPPDPPFERIQPVFKTKKSPESK